MSLNEQVTCPDPEDTCLIALTQDQFTLVDTPNFEYLSNWKWFAQWCQSTKSFYAVAKSEGRSIRMGRVLLGLERGNPLLADHENHNTLDNRLSNLRVVNRSQSAQNRRLPLGISGLQGITWWKPPRGTGHWRVQITAHKIQHFIGIYKNLNDARAAYNKAQDLYHGEFAYRRN